MKVKQLVKLLQEQNQELDVVLCHDTWTEIETVQQDDNNGLQIPVVVIQ
jgi:hypothetical protein